MGNIYTVKDVADKLQLHQETIKRKIYDKELRAYKVSNQWRIKEDDLVEWIESESNIKG